MCDSIINIYYITSVIFRVLPQIYHHAIDSVPEWIIIGLILWSSINVLVISVFGIMCLFETCRPRAELVFPNINRLREN